MVSLFVILVFVNFVLLGQAQFAWLNITPTPVDITLLNDLPLSCEICYVTLHEQSPQAQWCYALHYKEEAELVSSRLFYFMFAYRLVLLYRTSVHCALRSVRSSSSAAASRSFSTAIFAR
jgi:hypothetical protein